MTFDSTFTAKDRLLTRNKPLLSIALLSLLLSACSHQYGRYQQKHDSIPTRLPSQHELEDAIPRAEAPSRGGNKNYQVRGKHYQVLQTAKDFEQTGIASWYGKKFHGHLTSNGEIYNMYGMSAAHKNLPLPTYLKVTNLANQKSVVVRVNDRGPFHQDRIIDLSYSAAYKIGMLKTGTAKVHIEAITEFDRSGQAIVKTSQVSNQALASPQTQNKPKANVTSAGDTVAMTTETAKAVMPANTSPPIPRQNAIKPQPAATKEAQDNQANRVAALGFNKVIQVFATRNKLLAENTATALNSLYQLPVNLPEDNGIYRIQLGPFKQSNRLHQTLKQLKQSGYPNAFVKSL